MKRYKNFILANWVLFVMLLFFSLIIPFNCAKKKPKDIKIGAILPLTGESAKWGEASKNGIDLAVSKINEAGGINNTKVKILYEDDQGNTRMAVDAITKLINVDKVPIVIGTLFSSATLAISPIAEKNKVILFSSASTAPKISDAGDYIFRNCASDILEGKYMAQFVIDSLKLNDIAIIYINNDYGVGLKDAFSQELNKLGRKVIISENFEQGSTDFRTQLTKIKSHNPEAIYMPGYPSEMGLILKQAKEMGIKAQFLSIVIFEDPKIIEIAGDAAEGVIFSSRVYNPESEDSVVADFVRNYDLKFGSVPNIYAGLAYDAMRIIAFAIENGGKNPSDIKNALYNIKNFPGVTGVSTFDENGDVDKPIKMKVVKNGKFLWYLEK